MEFDISANRSNSPPPDTGERAYKLFGFFFASQHSFQKSTVFKETFYFDSIGSGCFARLAVDVRFCSCDCEGEEIDCVAVDFTLRCFRSADGRSELCCKPIVFQSRIDVFEFDARNEP